MKRISVRVPSASWTLLGTLAQAHGVSKCYLWFSLLYVFSGRQLSMELGEMEMV